MLFKLDVEGHHISTVVLQISFKKKPTTKQSNPQNHSSICYASTILNIKGTFLCLHRIKATEFSSTDFQLNVHN